jgi:hypothetical protein
MTKDEALRLALEALKSNRRTHHYCEDTWYSCPKHEDGCANDSEGDECNCGADKANAGIDQAITAIKAALEAKDEPVAWRDAAIRLGEELSSVGPDGYYDMDAKEWLDWAMEQNPRGKRSLPQRTWVGLSDEDRFELAKAQHGWEGLLIAAEAKLKQKNFKE